MTVAGFVGMLWLTTGGGALLPAGNAFQNTADRPGPGGDARQLWVHEDPKSIDHFAVAVNGNLLLMTDERATVLDRATGTAVWSRNDIRSCSRARGTDLVQFRDSVRCKLDDRELGFSVVGANPPLLVGLNPEEGDFAVVELSAGKTVYRADGRARGKVRDYSYHDAARRLVLWVEGDDERYTFASVGADGQLAGPFEAPIKKDLVWLGARDDGSVLVYGKDRNDKRVVAEVDFKAGRVAWQASGVLNEDIEDGPKVVGGGGRWRQKPYRFTPPVFDTGSSVVLFITKDGPVRVSRDGKVLWRGEALKGKDPSFIESVDGVVVVADDKDVVGLDAAAGRVLWRHKGRSNLAAVESHARGLLVWSDENVDLLNPRTGSAVWKTSVGLPQIWNNGSWLTEDLRPDYSRLRSPKRIVGDVAYVAGPTRLVSIDLQEGTVQDVASYTFQGNVPVAAMEMVDGDFVLTAPDAIARFDRQGQAKFQQSYKAVGNSGGAKAGAVAGFFLSPFAVSPVGMWAAFAQRYGVSADDDRYAYFLFEGASGNPDQRFGIVCVERASGKELGTLWVNDRTPDVVFDPASNTAYFKPKNNTIRAVRFELR